MTKNIKRAWVTLEEQEWAGREGRLQRLREVNHVIFFKGNLNGIIFILKAMESL